ncbi:helix-turn-helix domain-containing protein [uncultured Bacteroides sp.]|uniref:helix-turn-helix domain-containing protein n=1 Tax=uncultured Bacteroides sp. TaxID=162156 RepID=UPI0025DBD2E8|nr:helix-turn-helix domain-containing protein [uncultured Bacteroides sp.]
MEVISMESKAFAALMEKLEAIGKYVEESRQRELEQQQGEEEKNRRKGGKWMTGKEVCEYLEISLRTLQRYRTNRIIAFSICGKKISYRRTDVEQFRERWMRETPDKQIDRMIEEHPIHQRKYKLYGKKRGNTGKDE